MVPPAPDRPPWIVIDDPEPGDLEREAFEAVDAVARRGGGRDPRERPGAGDLVLVDTSHGLRVWCPLAIPIEGGAVGWRSLPAAIRTPADRDAALWRSGPVVNGRGTLERWRELTAEGIVLHVEADPVCEWGDDGAIRWNEPPDIDPC